MYIDDTVGASCQASLHQRIILAEIRGIQRPSDIVVDEILPGNGQSVQIHSIIVREVVHLTNAIYLVTIVLE